MSRVYAVLLPLFFFLSCKETGTTELEIPAPVKQTYQTTQKQLSPEEYYDKILGALVGSAIGDAMGASTEMWHRKDIQLKYGYITGLTPAVRPQSPEGTWDNNLLPGATTDDTRWKMAMVQYFVQNKGELSPDRFTDYIIDYYHSLTQTLQTSNEIPKTDFLDEQIEKLDWIKEWARVSMAYKESYKNYSQALSRFYGGEMSCAGQLYTPMFGLISQNAEEAYQLAFDHALFDIGYAKDISAMVSAMTFVAMRTQSIDSIINTATFVDPNGFQDSRLVGRISYSIADASVENILTIDQLELQDRLINTSRVPKGYIGSQENWLKQEMAYSFLEENQKAIPFHAGEIWEILITGLQFGSGDFEKTMQFIVNYGRDNDTVAAVAGMILGAQKGYSNLPAHLRTEVLKVNQENMGIDLQQLAQKLAGQRIMN
ncbi:ADP-ribosylglycohydrolase family protein [Euzebyella saccharophila]|uniref:ADP-ribosylglycohydrolase family protein n=1 Tax=Euzebyella saccharophila TaxID=679664 RepID=A0ABV8JKS0_9FLAO|nr:ADP-ribosylglycohydrolase family protein [Euzebyella saccharophila]